MQRITNYEVYILSRGRWTLHARYSGTERDEAIHDAQQTEYDLDLPTKVVRESYYPHLNHSDEITAYISPKAKRRRVSPEQGSGTGQSLPSSRHARAAAVAKSGHAAATPKPIDRIDSTPEYFFRFVGSLLGSIVIAGLTTGLVRVIIQVLPTMGLTVPLATTTSILTWSFVTMFCLSAVALVRSYAPVGYLFKGQAKPKSIIPRSLDVAPPISTKRVTPVDARKDEAEVRRLRGDLDAEPAPQKQRQHHEPQESEVDAVHADSSEPDNRPMPADDTSNGSAEQKAEQKEAVSAGETAPASHAPEEDRDSWAVDLLTDGPGKRLADLILGRFARACISDATRHSVGFQEPETRKATLFLAGATHRFGEEIGLIDTLAAPILSTVLHDAGMPEDKARVLAHGLRAEAPNANQTPAFKAGSDAMDDFLHYNEPPRSRLEGLLDMDMGDDGTEEAARNEIVVLTGVTLHSNSLGNPRQDIPGHVRERHVGTVRTILTDRSGYEIRKSRTGVLCAFPSLKLALGAVSDIIDQSSNLRSTGFNVRFSATEATPSDLDDEGLKRLTENLDEAVSTTEPGSLIWHGRLTEEIISEANWADFRLSKARRDDKTQPNVFFPEYAKTK